MDSKESQNNIEKNDKYNELFEKYKNENNMISEENLQEILNEYGRKTTSEQIKQITGNEDFSEITFDQFVQVMEKETNNTLITKQKNEISNTKLYFFIMLFLFTGSINTIIIKIQMSIVSLGITFGQHQKFLTFFFFCGELLCLLFYYINEIFINIKKNNSETLISKEEEENKGKKKPKIWYFLFPATLDILGSTISLIGLFYLSSSIFQMFRGALIIFVCIATIIIIKAKYYRHHFLGIFLVILGLIIVGLNEILKEDSNSQNPILGIFLVLLSQIFTCFQLIIQEKILKGYQISELKAVGLEGLWGVTLYLILLFIFYFIDCKNWPNELKANICVTSDNGSVRFEDAIFAFRQIGSEIQLLFFLLVCILSVAFFNFSGLFLAKHVTSTLRSILDSMRTIIVWSFFCLMTFIPDDTQENFSWLQLGGFIILVLGGAIYNELLVIPFCKFGYNTKKEIKKRELCEKNKSIELNKDEINENNNKI